MTGTDPKPESPPRELATFEKGGRYVLGGIHGALLLLFIGVIALVIFYPRRVSLEGGYAMVSRPEVALHAVTDGVWNPLPISPGAAVTNGQVLGRIASDRHDMALEQTRAEQGDLAARVLARHEDFSRAEVPDVRDDNRRVLEEVCMRLSESWRRRIELERMSAAMTVRVPFDGHMAAHDGATRSVKTDDSLIRIIPHGDRVVAEVRAPIKSATKWYAAGSVTVEVLTSNDAQDVSLAVVPGSFSSHVVNDSHTPPEAWGSFHAAARLQNDGFRLPQACPIVSWRLWPFANRDAGRSEDVVLRTPPAPRHKISSIELPAVCRWSGNIEIGAEVSGLLEEMTAYPGMTVTNGQLLARIRSVRPQLLTAAHSNAIAAAQHEAEAARAFADSYRSQWPAKEELARSNYLSRLELAEFRHRMEQAVALAAAAEKDLRKLESDAGVQEWDSALHDIRASRPGVVETVYRRAGENLRPNALLMNLRSFDTRLQILLPQISDAQKARIMFETADRGIPLKPDWSEMRHIAGRVWALPLPAPDKTALLHGEILHVRVTLHEDRTTTSAGQDAGPSLADLFLHF